MQDLAQLNSYLPTILTPTPLSFLPSWDFIYVLRSFSISEKIQLCFVYILNFNILQWYCAINHFPLFAPNTGFLEVLLFASGSQLQNVIESLGDI